MWNLCVITDILIYYLYFSFQIEEKPIRYAHIDESKLIKNNIKCIVQIEIEMIYYIEQLL